MLSILCIESRRAVAAKNKLSTSAHPKRSRVQNRLFSKTFLDVKTRTRASVAHTCLVSHLFQLIFTRAIFDKTVQCTTVLLETARLSLLPNY